MKETAYIGLGSNLGDGRRTLQLAWLEIGRIPQVEVLDLSSPYLSAPVGMESSNWFTNGVGKLETALNPEELLRQLLIIEHDFGRRREAGVSGYQDRTLDLDILYFGDMVTQTETLVLPHPRINERLFVLSPLAELAPHFRDPVDGATPAEKLARLERQMSLGSVAGQEIERREW